jgi:hypothetical protein
VLFESVRAESFYDVENLASWISLGAVLENMQIAAADLGLRLDATVFPKDDRPGVVVKARLEQATAQPQPLAAAIAHRCTNRRAYRREAVSDEIRLVFEQAITQIAGARLSWVVAPDLKRRVARIAAENDALLFEHRALHDGLYRWLRWTPRQVAQTSDGMPIDTLELGLLERPGFRLAAAWPLARALSLFGMSRAAVMRSARVYARSSAIALVTVERAAPEDFVRGGQTVQRLWLTATARGLAFQPMTGITFLLLRLLLREGEGLSARHRERLARLRDQLQRILPVMADRFPVMLFRVGLAPPPSARSLRLPLAAVFSEDTA